jgi:hypothetical protein
MRKTSKRLSFVGFILVAFVLLSVPLTAAFTRGAALSYAKSGVKKTSISENWSGYVAESNMSSPTNGFVTSVKGSWTVPTLTRNSSMNTYVAIWVGIDGFSDRTVEQIGTEQEWVNGVQQNYAWIELYPNPSQIISGITVHAEDHFNASVLYKGNNYFSFSIIDLTTGQSYSRTLRASAQRQSAEWIVEAPSSGGGVLPLAKFSTVHFSNTQFTDSTNTAFAINGRGLGTYDAIIINDPAGGTAAPSVLLDTTYPQGPSTFIVTYGANAITPLSYGGGAGGSRWGLLVV